MMDVMSTSMNPAASHPVREAISHVEDLDLEELDAADLDALHTMALELVADVEQEWFRRDTPDPLQG